MIKLGNRVHMFAQPDAKDDLIAFFVGVLGCEGPFTFEVQGQQEPILVFGFAGGGSLSIEFVHDALEARDARRGAWLELVTDDPEGLERKILDAGLSRIEHPGTGFFYFQAPGGPVMRIAPAER